MVDLFGKRIDTRENAIMRMRPSTCVDFIDATKKKLPRTVSLKWHHNFLEDIRQQLAGGYRASLTPAQIGHLLRTADHAGVHLDEINNGDRPMTKPNSNKHRKISNGKTNERTQTFPISDAPGLGK